MARKTNPRGSVQLKKRTQGHGIWVYRYMAQDGSRPSVPFANEEQVTTKTAAWHEAERLRLPEKYLGHGAPDVEGKKTVGHLIDRYKHERMPTRFSTRHAYTYWIDNYIAPQFEKSLIEDLTRPMPVEGWLNSLKLAPKTKGHIKTMLKLLMKYAMKWGWVEIGANPIKLIDIEGGIRRKRKPKILTVAQFEALWNAIHDDHVRVLVIVCMCMGIRLSEVLGLKWVDIDWEQLEVKISRGVVLGRVGDVKTEYSDATLPLDPELGEFLLQWQRRAPFTEPEHWVFASPFKGGLQPYFPTAIQRKIHAAAKVAGLADLLKGEPTKIFRHSYRSWLSKANTDVATIKDLMRHSDIRTTMNVYGDAVPESMRKGNSGVVRLALGVTRGAKQ